ncbi:MFS transporter [Streptomyces sp. 4F14]|uniref:MFS transporter n=1 Tax=Streptomyces sp. 4F14 TaxID=3394380 RepID=UPI003A859073
MVGMDRSLRAARAATFVYFVLNGTLIGMWVVLIPAVEERVGMSGRLTDRLGTRVVVPAAGVLCSASLVLPGLAEEPWALAVALLVFGFCNGCLDVGMNAHAVHVEKAYGRPVMAAFHATFSVGVGLSTAATLGVVAAAGVAVALASARALLPATPETTHATSASRADTHATPAPATPRATPTRVWALATLALMIMLCEGAANDWSALHLKSVLDAPETTAAFGYGTFAAAMTVGRLFADRLAARSGPTAILRDAHTVLTTVPAASSAATSSAGAALSVTSVCRSAEGPTYAWAVRPSLPASAAATTRLAEAMLAFFTAASSRS